MGILYKQRAAPCACLRLILESGPSAHRARPPGILGRLQVTPRHRAVRFPALRGIPKGAERR